MELQKATGYLKNAFYQGHGRYVNQVARITIKFCKSSGNSREVRKFIETRLVDIAKDNPGCVIYVKPRLFKGPVIKAEYLNGESHSISLHRMGLSLIEAFFDWHLTRSGYKLYKFNRSITTYRPSIQPMWTPFTFRDPSLNIAQLPSQELGQAKVEQPSATDVIKREHASQIDG